jgi:hypothetical protein
LDVRNNRINDFSESKLSPGERDPACRWPTGERLCSVVRLDPLMPRREVLPARSADRRHVLWRQRRLMQHVPVEKGEDERAAARLLLSGYGSW